MPTFHPSAAPAPSTAPAFRGRIGAAERSGYPPVPHRYRLHLTPSCTNGLRIAVTHNLLDLAGTLPATRLPAVPDTPDGTGYLALRPLYQASAHRYLGPLAGPVLSDDWTGRIVSTHTPDILDDLTRHFAHRGPDLRGRGGAGPLRAVDWLCEQDINAAAQQAGRADTGPGTREAALRTLLNGLQAAEHHLADREFWLDDRLTLADVQLWATLVQLDTVHRWHLDAAAVQRLAGHPRLWAYARRLAAHPAFGAHLDLDGIALRHHAHCRGREAAGAAMPIVDWAAAAARQPSTIPAPTPEPVANGS
ncbi:glutathione S-transferase C-terminal domain-containing protein [Streptomyces sp. NPDC047097]|uniref:glutathione S-transferase C-terminal domain-containing protein n=1 Tax=Streptomyces sp. NPDC047097 TaxID=3155260 RepID=UPI0033FCEDE6